MRSTGFINGIISGIDYASLINAIITIEKKPADQLQKKSMEKSEELASWMSLNTSFLSLRNAVLDLGSGRLCDTVEATSSNESLLSVRASSEAQEGEFHIRIISTAKAHQIASQGIKSKDETDIGEGIIKLNFGGQYNEIEINDQNNSLEGLKNEINRLSPDLNATIVSTGDPENPYTLLVSSLKTGSGNKITIDTSGLTGGEVNLDFHDIEVASDAKLWLGSEEGGATPIEIFSSTNILENVIPGLTLNLKGSDPDEEIIVKISKNSDNIVSKVNNFIDQFNASLDKISNEMKYIPATDTSGPLLGDALILRIHEEIKNQVSGRMVMVDGKSTTLRTLGIYSDDNGRLSLDESVLLDKCAKEPDRVIGYFEDLSKKFSSYLTGLTDPISGSISWTGKNLENQIQELSKSIEQIEKRISLKQARLYKEFESMENKLQEFQSQGQFLNAQISMLMGANNKT